MGKKESELIETLTKILGDDFINKIKLNKEYQERTKTWKDYTREEQADLLMRYVEDIELDIIGTVIVVKQINFRESICKSRVIW